MSSGTPSHISGPLGPTDHYTFHMFPFSLYSIMSRFTYVLGRASLGGQPDPLVFDLQLVNLHRNEHISEDHLTRVNPKGQVPALTGDKLPSPLTDSLDISFLLCEYYPQLLPPRHAPEIRNSLSQLHKFHALPLSVSPAGRGHVIPCEDVDERLARQDISPTYRQALEFKKRFHDQYTRDAVSLENVQWAETKTRELCESLAQIYQTHGNSTSAWLFGPDTGPTVLDAHVVAYFVRLLDMDRRDLIPDSLRQYTERIKAGSEWNQVTHGRSTIWSISVGHVGLLDPL